MIQSFKPKTKLDMKYVLNPLAIYELGQRSNQEDSIFPVSGEVTAERPPVYRMRWNGWS